MGKKKNRFSATRALSISVAACLVALLAFNMPAHAINQLPTPEPQQGSYGVEATKTQPPPTQGATITTPGNGAGFTSPTTTVNGICPTDLLVEVYDNGVMVGSVMCKGGSFSVQISLFSGSNALTALDYDDLEQAGPATNTNTVTYTDTHFTAFGSLITLTSSYGRLASPTGTPLNWPLQLSGGTGPYAFSIDWGDGGKPELKSQSLGGVVTISHIYKTAGIYQMNVTVTDVNGVSAFLQLIAVASGKVDASAASSSAGGNGANGANGSTAQPKILWVPAAVSLVLLAPTYWLGRRSQVVSIRNKILRDQANAKES